MEFMQIQYDQIKEVIRTFAVIPDRIARAIAGRTSQELVLKPGEGEWSAHEILAHMRAADDICTPRIYMILVRDNAPLISFNERRWADIAGYEYADFYRSLTLFTLRRSEVVEVLKQLQLEDWERVGQHEEHGPVSLLDIVHGITVHETEHCEQIEALFHRA
jgi:hypothetical protein